MKMEKNMADESRPVFPWDPPPIIWAVNGRSVRTGRKAIKTDSRTLKLGNYLTSALPDPPASVDWTKKITAPWGMMLNDQLGDCTIAGCGHAIQTWTSNFGSEQTISDDDVKAAYSKWDGYVDGDSSTDNGGIELDVLKRWKNDGLVGHNILAFADPNVFNLNEIRQAIHLFGGVYIGVALPITAQSQTVWDVVDNGGDNAAAGSWGGHCVYVNKYDEKGFSCVTWGSLMYMTTAFWLKYVDEAHAILGKDWVENNVNHCFG